MLKWLLLIFSVIVSLPLLNSGHHRVAPQDGLLSTDFSSCKQFQLIWLPAWIEPAETAIPHCLSGVKNMSKELKNKRESKKKAVLSPKEKKAAKQSKKETKNVLGN